MPVPPKSMFIENEYKKYLIPDITLDKMKIILRKNSFFTMIQPYKYEYTELSIFGFISLINHSEK